MWTKLCGIADPESSRAAAAARPDAIGLNFFEQSPRYVTPIVAKAIVADVSPAILPVGLFVNHPVEEIAAICDDVGLTHVQLHGDETAADVAELLSLAPELQIIRAFRIGEDGLHSVAEFLRECRSREMTLFACLLDARVDGRYGGTGDLAPWEVIRDHYRFDDWPPLILAGGLTPDNVSDAIHTVRPWGVDTASGVELEPGVKSAELCRRFVEAAGSR